MRVKYEAKLSLVGGRSVSWCPADLPGAAGPDEAVWAVAAGALLVTRGQSIGSQK